MCNIRVGRYKRPEKVGFQGWIEPDDLSWIAFVDLTGRVTLHIHRDPETGAVL